MNIARLLRSSLVLLAATAAAACSDSGTAVAGIDLPGGTAKLTLTSPVNGDTVWGRAVPIFGQLAGYGGNASLTYELNGGAPRPVNLAEQVYGDVYDLRDGANTIVFSAVDSAGRKLTMTVQVVAVVPPAAYSPAVLVAAAGDTASVALGMSGAGAVIGWSTAANGTRSAVLWRAGTAALLDPIVRPYAVNDRGQVVGDAVNAAYLWENGSVTALATTARPVDINGVGHILNASLPARILRGALADTLPLPPTSGAAYVRAINASDVVVGQDGSLYPHATRWVPGKAPMGINVGISRESGAVDINDGGQVIGWRSLRGFGTYSPEYLEERAFLAGTDSTVDLSAHVGFGTVASALNAGGAVAGTYHLDGQVRAYVWQSGRMRNVVLTDPSWTIDSVVGISDAGQLAVNAHNASGARRALLLTPQH